MSNICPLCGSVDVSAKETIRGAEVNSLFERNFGVPHALTAHTLNYCVCQQCSLAFFSPLETGGAALYEHLQTFDWYYMEEKEEFQIAMRFVPKTGSVLEVGSGKAAFATHVGVERYTGLEFNSKAIERAKEKGIALIKESIEDHAKSHPQKYDVVVSFQVLEHVASPYDFINGCVDSLKTGGLLLLAVPSSDGFAGRAINNVLDMPPHHVTHWSEKTLRFLPQVFGLETIAVEHEYIPDYHRQYARKVQFEVAIRDFLGMKFKLLDMSFRSRLIAKMAGVAAHFFGTQENFAKGHTAVGVYRKV